MREWLRKKSPVPMPPTSNEAWLAALQGGERDRAIQALRVVLVRGLRAVLAKRIPGSTDALAEDFAQEGLIKILDNLDTFRGESRFTTWAQKIAVRVALSELRRRRWQDVSLHQLGGFEEAGPTAPVDIASAEYGPDARTNLSLIAQTIQQVMAEVLTERQRTAVAAVMLHEMPLEEVARRMDTNRNALYKLLHDARMRMRKALQQRGISLDTLPPDP